MRVSIRTNYEVDKRAWLLRGHASRFDRNNDNLDGSSPALMAPAQSRLERHIKRTKFHVIRPL